MWTPPPSQKGVLQGLQGYSKLRQENIPSPYAKNPIFAFPGIWPCFLEAGDKRQACGNTSILEPPPYVENLVGNRFISIYSIMLKFGCKLAANISPQ